MVVDEYGEQSTGRAWLAQLSDARDSRLNLRNLRVLHRGEVAVVVGEEVATGSGLTSRFTRVWTSAPEAMQLRAGQTTPAATEVFRQQPGPDFE
jgi:hypothetical protein